MRFVTEFPGGNGKCLSAREMDWGWEIEFLAESKAREPQPLWFYFRLEDLYGEKVRLRLANSGQCLGSKWITNRPVYRYAGGKWMRLEGVEEYWTENHQQITWFEVPLQGDLLEFAFCYPYQESHLMQTLRECPRFQQEIIGYSSMGRPIYRVYNHTGQAAQRKPGVYILGRSHSGEVPGSWEIDGMLRYLSSDAGAETADRLNWWFVPMVDVDGVEEGFYGKDQIYHDLNRAWHAHFPGRTELVAIERDMRYYHQACQGCLMLDLHGPGHSERDSYFVVRYETPDDYRQELWDICQQANIRLMQAGMQPIDFHEKPAGNNTSAQTGWTSTVFAQENGFNGCTIECSYQGERNGKNYTIADYQTIGAFLAQAIAAVLLAKAS